MKLLFLTSRFPYPTNKGDKLRAYYQIKEISTQNEIHLVLAHCVSQQVEEGFVERKKVRVGLFNLNRYDD